MRILVTGAAGFIGSHLVERLLSLGHEVTGWDDFNPSYDPAVKQRNIESALGHPNFCLNRLDIRDQSKVKGAIKEEGFEAVIHLAARAGVRPSLKDPQIYQEVNVIGTINLLEEVKGAGLATFIFGSSSSVYGRRSQGSFSESDPVDRPLSPYAASKISAELLCRYYADVCHLPVTCLRFFTVYGPRQRPDMAIHKFSRLIRDDKEIPIYGAGDSGRDYTYIGDIVDGIISALNRPFPFEIINLGNSRPVKLYRLISLLEKALGKKARVKNVPAHPADVPITCADLSKAKARLTFSPKVSLEEGISEFVAWLNQVEQQLS
ncbi:MAG: NAD-dependent epimerase/dehydratase family protein [Thermodesulfobacteriota bacterium]